MAKVINRVRVVLNSADTTFDHTGNTVDYRVTDGDLSKRANLCISGISTAQTVENFWADVISAIEAEEGI